ncbi:MAG: AAA family ATPase [Elusimicrobiota bacterium]|nr:AAA family ATPase [Elusimicrobiota bacterium]
MLIDMIKDRYLSNPVVSDLKEKMVFISGPRQIGKTTLAFDLMKNRFKNIAYYCWDNRQDRKDIISSNWNPESKLIVLDEIHKMKKWKSFVKGEYDKLKSKYKFIVTGSARLDVYRKGGDSLQGRYHFYQLHPFSLMESLNEKINIKNIQPLNSLYFQNIAGSASAFEALYKFGGFPEPYLRQNERFLRRWQNEKLERFFREDIRDSDLIKDINSVKLLSDILPDRVSNLLSINSLREDLEVSHKAVKNWLNVFELFYYIFRIYPYTKTTYKSLKKEPKMYLWDWSEIEDEGKRFENMIASHLLKYTNFLHDNMGYNANIYFLRDLEKREIDFLIEVEGKPWFSIEIKLNEENISPNFKYFISKLNIPFNFQVVKKKNIDKLKNGVRVISADKFLTALI